MGREVILATQRPVRGCLSSIARVITWVGVSLKARVDPILLSLKISGKGRKTEKPPLNPLSVRRSSRQDVPSRKAAHLKAGIIMKKIREMVFLTLMGAGFTGCQKPLFDRVDFKYGSFTYINPADLMTQVGYQPEDLAMRLSDAFRQSGGIIVERKELKTTINIEPECEPCWRASHDLSMAEIQTFRENDFEAYKLLKSRQEDYFTRYKVTSLCRMITQPNDPNLEQAFYLAIDINSRTETTTLPTYSSFISVPIGQSRFSFTSTTGGETIGVTLKSRIKFWIWKYRGEPLSHVYIEACPTAGDREARSGNSIGHHWWSQTTGEAEARLAKHFLLLLQEMEYRRKSA